MEAGVRNAATVIAVIGSATVDIAAYFSSIIRVVQGLDYKWGLL